MTQDTYLYDGKKAVRISDLPASAWTWYTQHLTEEDEQIQTRYVRVPWLNRGVGLRSSALAALPFALVDQGGEDYDVSTDWENKVGFLPNPSRLLYLLESSLSLLGQGYLFKEQNRVKLLNLRYYAASTITPQYREVADEEGPSGLIGFVRRIGAKPFWLTPEDLVYFWTLDPFKEIGPGDNSPAMAALSATGVLYNVDEFASKFFERGAIKVTLLTVKGPIVSAERERLESWWSRVFQGIRSAWQQKVVQADKVEPVVIGEGVGELSDSELTKEKREDISIALGIPVSILWSTEAGGLGGGGVVQSDERKFYEQTIVPEAKFIQGVLNEQIFNAMGLTWKFRPETLDIFQADENQRSQALVHYTSAGYRLSVASQILGVELPPGMEYEDLDAMKQEDKEQAISNMQEGFGGDQAGPPGQDKDEKDKDKRPENLREKALLDLAKWKRKALYRGADCGFESEHIPSEIWEQVARRLAVAESSEEIKAAFNLKAPRVIPEGADEPLPPIPNEVVWSEQENARADALWDRLMPELRGMLNTTEVIGQTDYDGEQY